MKADSDTLGGPSLLAMSTEPDGGIRFPDLPKLELDDLIDQLVDRAQDVKRAQGRLRALLHAIETVTGDLSLETVLRNVVQAACDLAHAQYGALGVIGPDGRLEQFLYVGIDADLAARIGNLPQGRGLLGALITDPRPIRLRHMRDDGRSAGFPRHHPPMDSFMGVPIHVRDEVFGNLYLANSAGGEFSAEDQELLIALALAAGTAISNARLYHESRLQQRWLEASIEIGAQLQSSSGEDPLQLVARRAVEIADADLVSIGLVTAERTHLVVEVAIGERADTLVGRRVALGNVLAGQVVDHGTPLLLTDPAEGGAQPPVFADLIDAGPIMVLPLRAGNQVRGVLNLVRTRGKRAFTRTELTMAAGFASHASVALELADSRAAEQKLILLEDRDRIAMDLHDHVIQELFATGLRLEGVAAALGDENPGAQRVRRGVEDIDRTIRRIRTSIFELQAKPSGAPEDGLQHRVLAVAAELSTPLGFAPHVAFSGLVDLLPGTELPDDVIACVREALTNVAKHANATSASVDISLVDKELTVTVSDNGTGAKNPQRSSGIANLRARAAKWHGSFEINTGPAGGTVATWKAHIR